MDISNKAVFSMLVVVIIVTGIGVGYVIEHPNMAEVNKAQTSGNILNLVEIMDANFSAGVGAQPRFYVDDNGALTSSATIDLPTNTAIHMTIVSYDMGNASVASQFLNVTGTVGNSLTLINGNIAMGSNLSQAWETTVHQLPASEVLHTFTILQGAQVLVNIPVVPNYTEMATFYLNTTGTFTWQCEAACGTGPSGWGGPMSTSGWMMGSVVVQ